MSLFRSCSGQNDTFYHLKHNQFGSVSLRDIINHIIIPMLNSRFWFVRCWFIFYNSRSEYNPNVDINPLVLTHYSCYGKTHSQGDNSIVSDNQRLIINIKTMITVDGEAFCKHTFN